MSKNQKSINIFKEFFQEKMGADPYDIEKFNLKGNYPLLMMCQAETGGSSGGDCWGGRTSDYDKHESDIVDSIARDVQYKLRGLAHSFNLDEEKIKTLSIEEAKSVRWSYVGSKEEGGDYYGNHTEYKMFPVDALKILKEVMDKKDYEILEGVASTVKLVKDREYKSADLLKQEQELVNKIGAFVDVKSEELEKTKKALQDAKQRVVALTARLNSFDTQKSKEKSTLKTQLEKVRKERMAHDGPDVAQCTVKKETKKNRY